MKQAYHSNAVTNIHLRCEISKSNLSTKALSLKYDVSEKTISKWKNRQCATLLFYFRWGRFFIQEA